MLDSNRDRRVGSLQDRWLRAELAQHRRRCLLAYWHIPRFSSGREGGDAGTRTVWRRLQDAGAEIVLSGHDHHYERFAPQTDDGWADSVRGIRQFVVGTGGAKLHPLERRFRNSEFALAGTAGVLHLALHPDRYSWRFLTVHGAVADSGTGRCRAPMGGP